MSGADTEVAHRDADAPGHTKRWWILGALALCLTITGIDSTILNVALPEITRELGASGSELQWMIASYTIVFAGLMLTAGAIGDRYGRRGALLFGLVWFSVASVLAAFATSPEGVIAGRSLMGVGAAFMFPTTLAILTNTFSDPHERARAIGIWSGASGIGVMFGPVLGGFLVEHLGWEAVFIVNIPLCAIAFFMIASLVPKNREPVATPLDPVGALLSIVALGSLLFAVIQGPEQGWAAEQVLAGFAVGMVTGAFFLWWEWRNPAPMMQLRLFRDRRLSAASGAISLVFFALVGSTFLLTLYFQFILGYSPVKSGVMLVPIAIGLMIGSPLAPRLVRAAGLGTRRVVVIGLVIGAVCMFAYGSDSIMSSFAIAFGVRLVSGFSTGLSSTPATASVMESAPPEQAGIASAINNVTRTAGGAVGIAVLGSIFAARYHSVMDSTRGLPPDVLRKARESIGASLEVAKGLPGDTADAVRAAAHQAFLSSMRITFTIAAVAILFGAVIAWRFLPDRVTPLGPAEEEPSDALLIAVEESSV